MNTTQYPTIPERELHLGCMGRGDLDWASRVAKFRRPACMETLPQQVARITSTSNVHPVVAHKAVAAVELTILPCKGASYHDPEMGEGRLAAIADSRIAAADFVNRALGLLPA